MVDVVGLLVIVVLAALFIFLVTRALRARNGFLKWGGTVLFGLLSLIALAALVLAGIGSYKLSVPKYSYGPVSDVKVAGTPEQIEQGRRVANLCADCHSSKGGGNELLDGGQNFLAGGPPLGEVHPSNLTPGGELKDWSDGEIIRAIREGIHKSGRTLVIMPAMAFNKMSDDDVHAIVAYLRSQPAVADTNPKNHLNVLAAIMIGAGMIPPEVISAQPPVTGPVTAPAAGTMEHGNYLASVMGCRDCHGLSLDGNGAQGAAPNLTVLVPKMTEEGFMQTIRTGKDPSGHELNPEAMPWKSYAKALTDAELKDLYSYMSQLPPSTAQGQTP